MWAKDGIYRRGAWGNEKLSVKLCRVETVIMLDLLGSDQKESSYTRRILTVCVFPSCVWLRVASGYSITSVLRADSSSTLLRKEAY